MKVKRPILKPSITINSKKRIFTLMFRQLAHISLVFLLLTATTGVAISKHYCMNRLLSMSIGESKKSCCNEAEAMGCCHNETEQVQVEDDFSLTVVTSLPEVELPVLYTICALELITQSIEITEPNFYTDTSPPPIEPDIYLKVQSFLL